MLNNNHIFICKYSFNHSCWNCSRCNKSCYIIQKGKEVCTMARELQQLIETVNAPIFGIDVHTKEEAFSKAFSKPLVSIFIVPFLRQSVQEVLDKVLHENETSNYKFEFDLLFLLLFLQSYVILFRK